MDDMQSRIAARRRQIERDHLAEIAAKEAVADARDEDERVRERASDARAAARAATIKARDRERAAAERQSKRQSAAGGTSNAEKDATSWTTIDRTIVGAPIAAGLLLLASHPLWAVALLLLGAMLYAGAKTTHRDATLKARNEASDATGKPESP